MGLEGVVDQMTLRAPRDAGLKRERMMFGLCHAGRAALFRITHLNKVQLIRLAWLIRILSRLLAPIV